MVTGSTAILAVSSIPETIRYYTEVLGFPQSWTHGCPPTFGAVIWGNASLMFNLLPDLAARVQGHEHWFDVEDVNSLYDRHRAQGVDVISEIETKPWGRREYTVRDLNGYSLRFGGSPDYVKKGDGLFPPELRLVRRLPTQAEYEAVVGAAFHKTAFIPGILERTWGAVVAENEGGQAVGIVRIMYNADGWFSIWDVGVLPHWQGRQIGSRMMEEALEIVRLESPGAWVHLFTYQHKFYEKLGFARETVQMRKV